MPISDQVVDQFHHLSSIKEAREALDKIAIDYSEKYRRIILDTYTNLELRSMYNAIRESNDLNAKVKSGSPMRQILKIPNAYVLHFLNDVFTPEYGENWLKDKKTLWKIIKNEDLIKPWLTVKLKVKNAHLVA